MRSRRVQQHHADLRRVDLRVAARHAADEVVELGHYLDAGKAAARHDEGEQLAAQLRVVLLDRRLFEGVDDVVAQGERVAEVLERECVFGEAPQPAEVRDVAEREHQMVVVQDVLVRAEPRRGRDRAVAEVNGLDLADVQVRARQQPADGADHVRDADRAGDHFGQHRLEDEVVLLIDQHDLEIVAPPERLLKLLRRVDPGEPAAENDHALTCAFAHTCHLPFSRGGGRKLTKNLRPRRFFFRVGGVRALLPRRQGGRGRLASGPARAQSLGRGGRRLALGQALVQL